MIYATIIALVPLALVLYLLTGKQNELNNLEETLETIQYQATVKEKKQALNVAVRQHFREADHFYIDKNLETLIFLESELETLQKLSNDKSFEDDERIKRRIEFLTGTGKESNQMIFSEGIVQSFPLFQETVETLVHPVELNATDLQKILAKIEGVSMGGFQPGPNRPQLIITDLKLDKKTISENNEVYQLNLKLLKREYL